MPVKRSDSGVYSCSANNDVGQSQELEVNIDVKCMYLLVKNAIWHGKCFQSFDINKSVLSLNYFELKAMNLF